MRRHFLTTMALALALAASGCARASEPAPEPVTVSRSALGTVVSVTAYGRDGGSPEKEIETAFAAIAEVEQQLNAYSPTSTVAAFNSLPYTLQPIPAAGVPIFDSMRELDVARQYSPTMLGVMNLYDFEGSGRVPSESELDAQVALARSFRSSPDSVTESLNGNFRPLRLAPAPPPPGLDFAGAAKGAALSRAVIELEGDVAAALLTAGSTTLTLGSKPDGEPWRIGIEDPREPGLVIATVEATEGVTVSTSGDYQRYFERGGVRYHHILDPLTGQPVQGLRSMTVIGAETGVDSDVLSTALFVMGADEAAVFCRKRGLGMYAVDDEGRAHVVPAPSGAGWRLVEQAQPKK